jgi:shikimate dehydrogenase
LRFLEHIVWQGGQEAEELSFPDEMIRISQFIFDVVALPTNTPLIRQALALGKRTISGTEVAVIQATEQFVLYTGSRPSSEQIQRAAVFARA